MEKIKSVVHGPQLNKNIFTKTLPFVLVPLVLFVFSQILIDLKGPFFLGWNSDPEYAYLLNSVNLLHLNLPGHYDHPGTPMQAYGAGIILIRYFFVHFLGGVDSMHLDVLSNPEAYLRWINSSLILILGISLYCSGKMVYKYTKNLFLAFITQSVPFLFSALLLSTSRITPEPLMMFCVSLLSILFISEYFKQAVPFSSIRSVFLLGGLLGFGIAAKVTLIPLIFLVFLPSKMKLKISAVLSTGLSFLVFTLPILPLYINMLDWLKDLLIHKGIYGGGEVGLPDLDTLFGSFYLLVKSEPQFFILIIILGMLSSQMIKPKKEGISFKEKSFVILFLIFITQAGITIKHPAAHYMLPSMMISGILPVLFWDRLSTNKNRRTKIFSGFIGLCILCSFSVSVKEIMRIVDYNLSAKNTQELIDENYSDCIVADYYRSSTLTYALSYGNDYANLQYRDALHLLYPDAVAYEKWGQNFHQFGSRFNLPEIQLQLDGGTCWLMRGSPMTDLQLSELPVKVVRLDADNLEALYKVVSVK